MTIASLTAASAAPPPASKGAASPVQTPAVTPDAQTAAVSTEAPAASNIEIAISAARQSAAARQDGLSVLMANLLRAAGNLPAPVQQAVDQLIALHMSTDVAPDAAAVKTALLTSGLFTEANLAAPGSAPADIKIALLQLNNAAENWLARATPASNAPPQPASASAPTQLAVRAEQTIPVAVPQSTAREPLRRTSARSNETASGKPVTPNAPLPQRAVTGKSQSPVEASAPAKPADAAPDAETIKSAIRVLGQITQMLKASGTPELPKDIKAVLALVNQAVTSSLTPLKEPQTATLPATSPGAPVAAQRAATVPLPLIPAVMVQRATLDNASPSLTAEPNPSTQAPLPATPAQNATSAQIANAPLTSSQSFIPPRGSSPVEQLLALQLTPSPAAGPALSATPPPADISPELVSLSASGAPESSVAPQPDARSSVPGASQQSITSSSPANPAAIPSNSAPAPASIPNDVRTLLTLFSKVAEVWLPHAQAETAAAPSPSSQQPGIAPTPAVPERAAAIPAIPNAVPLPATPAAPVPNDLKTLLLLFNAVVDNWLPGAPANAPGDAHTPSVPPPVPGVPIKAQPAALATLPENADAIATAKQLLTGSDAALARQTLLQIASLPGAAPQTRTSDARWMFDVPLMTAQGAAVAQMIIERDGSGMSAERPTPVWRVQFAIDIEPLGPVRANLALSGDRAWVTITADRPDSLDKLQSGVSWLADALQATELNADIAFQPGCAPQGSGTASRFMDHAS